MVNGNVTKIEGMQTAMGLMYNVHVDNERYGYGKNKPNFNEGDNITFDVKLNGKYKNILANTVEVGSKQTKAAPVAASGTGNKDGYWEAKEQRDVATQRGIQQQSARNAAISLIVPLAVGGVVKLPAKAEDKLAAIASLIDEFTDRYYLATQNALSGEYSPEDFGAVPFTVGGDD